MHVYQNLNLIRVLYVYKTDKSFTWEKFCIQAQYSKFSKRYEFLAYVRLENDNKKFNLGGENINFFNVTAISENKRPCSIRTLDEWVGRSKLYPLCHRDRHQNLAI